MKYQKIQNFSAGNFTIFLLNSKNGKIFAKIYIKSMFIFSNFQKLGSYHENKVNKIGKKSYQNCATFLSFVQFSQIFLKILNIFVAILSFFRKTAKKSKKKSKY